VCTDPNFAKFGNRIVKADSSVDSLASSIGKTSIFSYEVLAILDTRSFANVVRTHKLFPKVCGSVHRDLLHLLVFEPLPLASYWTLALSTDPSLIKHP
jgi:hypothetical protein